ncbi:DUF4232 domain-containing protein [Frondihabitans australicus]|nr:DUF4232 domain-containing protein [Frondihabitans australicus]
MSIHRSTPTTRFLATVIVAVALAGALAGCTSTSHTTAPSTTVTVAPPLSSRTATPGASTGTSTATPAPQATTPAVSQRAGAECLTSSLTGSLTAEDGAAGTETENIVLTNHSAVPCTLQGWPGVSWVGDGNGTQIGPSAVLNRSSAHATVTIQAGGSAYAFLKITGYNADTCQLTKADGFRVYPPGQSASLFIAAPTDTACSGLSELTVDAISAKPAAL